MRTALLKLRKNSGRHAPPVSTNASKILNKTLLLFINTIIASSNCARGGGGATLFGQRPIKCPKNRSNPYHLPINDIYIYICECIPAAGERMRAPGYILKFSCVAQHYYRDPGRRATPNTYMYV